MRGVADERGPALRPLLQRRPVAEHPALDVLRLGRGDQPGERRGEPGGQLGRRRLRDPPAPGRQGRSAVSTHHWWPSRPLCRIDVQLPCVVRLWVRTHLFGTVPSTSAKVNPPKMCSRCSRLGASPHSVRRTSESMPSAPIRTSCSAVRAVGEVQRDRAVVLLDPLHLLVEPDHAVGDRGEHPLVQLGAQQPDEAAAEGLLHVLVELDVDADLALQVAELRVRGRAEVLGVHAERAQRLQRRRPQVEDVAGRPGLAVPLVDDDVVAGLERAEGGGHAGRSGAEDGDAAAERRGRGGSWRAPRRAMQKQ